MGSKNRKPNIIFVLTDDQGFGDLGCTGNPWIKSPSIDSFYQDSIRLINYHVGPTCAPTRASLLTGHYANSTGVWHTIGGRSLLRKDEYTIALALKDNGYRTGIFGKWHLGDNYPYRPQDRGFDVVVTHGGGGISQTPDFWGNDYFDDTYQCNGIPKKFSGYCTDVWFNEALGFIEQNKENPFFCYLPTNAPHMPYNVDTKYSSIYKDQVSDERAHFYGMITNIDENFGMLRKKLLEWGLEDNTILIFMTDNGTSGGATVKDGFLVDGYNAGFRGIKTSKYEGGHRVPFFIRWPKGGLCGGVNVDELTSNVDFMPTLLELCSSTLPKERTFHGKSIVSLLHGEKENWKNRTIVTDSQRVAKPIKWVRSCVMRDRFRLIDGKELYDIDVDREERNDISVRFPEIVRELRKEYEAWWKLVSQHFDEEIPISLGAKKGEETILVCHDWRNDNCECPWLQGNIRTAQIANGYWEVKIESDGEYNIELRRWPKESHHAIVLGIEGDDVQWNKKAVEEKNWNNYTGGRALPLKMVKLKIGNDEYEKKILPKDEGIMFNVFLKQGVTHLQSWFTDEENITLGAYYVYAKRIS